MKFDPAMLPGKALLDTGVFMRGVLGDRPNDAASPVCKGFCDAVLNSGRTLYVGAPTIAEVCRNTGARVPRYKGITVVPFDDRAAELLGVHIPMAKIRSIATETGLSMTYLKYDALIAACALRVGADALVAIDGDHDVIARGIDLRVARPDEFLEKPSPQTTIDDLLRRTRLEV